MKKFSISFNANSKNSREINELLIRANSMFNFFMKKDKKQEYEKIIYIPVEYVDLLRTFIMVMYEKSQDPITKGFMSRSNLEYAMEYVKEIYNDKSKKEQLIRKAAFVLYNITLKHPFTDGNKRTALITCNAFLEYNGFTIGTLPFKEAKMFMLDLAMGKKKEDDCQKFVRKHVVELLIKKEKTTLLKHQ